VVHLAPEARDIKSSLFCQTLIVSLKMMPQCTKLVHLQPGKKLFVAKIGAYPCDTLDSRPLSVTNTLD
jgi:hypothetical protein